MKHTHIDFAWTNTPLDYESVHSDVEEQLNALLQGTALPSHSTIASGSNHDEYMYRFAESQECVSGNGGAGA